MKIIFVLLIALTLSGCSLFNTKEVEVSTKPVEKVPLILPHVDMYRGRDIEWLIITPENYAEAINRLARKGSVSLFALSSVDYENASLNRNDILKLIKQLQEIIKAYEQYYANELTVPTESKPITEDKIPEIE